MARPEDPGSATAGVTATSSFANFALYRGVPCECEDRMGFPILCRLSTTQRGHTKAGEEAAV